MATKTAKIPIARPKPQHLWRKSFAIRETVTSLAIEKLLDQMHRRLTTGARD